ncbi:MAG: hypothetical protein A2075_20820 [Geobacteraceae bacterium GWC2_58_44]|nr:MAG: hypothetical protein A2075_20820 [Geobacteraceae bacterium GWC2_58_44]HBG05277.1 hypothetical protein [Geobacter sp.]
MKTVPTIWEERIALLRNGLVLPARGGVLTKEVPMGSKSRRQKEPGNLGKYYGTVMPILVGLVSVAIGVVYFSRPLLPLRSEPATRARQFADNGTGPVQVISGDTVPAYRLLEFSVGPRFSRPNRGMGGIVLEANRGSVAAGE